MKKYILILYLFKFAFLFSQEIGNELKIKRTKILLPEEELIQPYKFCNSPIKKINDGKEIRTFDINGNLIELNKKGFSGESIKTYFSYQENILTKKITTTEPLIKTRREQIKLETERELEESGIAPEPYLEKVQIIEHWTAKLNKKNKIISIIETTTKNDTTTINSKTKLKYKKNKLIKKSLDKKIKVFYTYDKDKLKKIKKLINKTPEFKKGIEVEEIFEYLYDEKNNLKTIYKSNKQFWKGKVNNNSTKRKIDSVEYNHNNQIVYDYKFKKYYDYYENGKIKTVEHYEKDQLSEKEFYFYNKELLTKIESLTYRYPKQDTLKLTTLYSYNKNGQLSSKTIENSFKFKLSRRYEYHYNKKNKLTKVVELTNPYINDKTGDLEFKKVWNETNYIFNEKHKTLTINSKHGYYKSYEFY